MVVNQYDQQRKIVKNKNVKFPIDQYQQLFGNALGANKALIKKSNSKMAADIEDKSPIKPVQYRARNISEELLVDYQQKQAVKKNKILRNL